MSRFYGMDVTVSGHNKERAEEIAAALTKEWPTLQEDFESCLNEEELNAYGEGYLLGGESENEFAERVAKAVWTANGRCCQVAVHCTYLEELPQDVYYFDEDNYAAIMEETCNE